MNQHAHIYNDDIVEIIMEDIEIIRASLLNGILSSASNYTVEERPAQLQSHSFVAPGRQFSHLLKRGLSMI